MDKNNREHDVSIDWIKINFESKHKTFFDHIKNLNVSDGYTDVPTGSRTLSIKKWPWRSQNKGPLLKYVQDKAPACLFCSLASAFSYINQSWIAEKVMQTYVYERKQDILYIPKMNDVLAVFRNKFYKTGEKRIKTIVKNISTYDYHDIINDKSQNIIYHCVLNNFHCITMCNDYIFDPAMRFAMPRNENVLRWCAEAGDIEYSSSLMKKLYKYDTKFDEGSLKSK